MAPRSLFEKFGHNCEIQSTVKCLPSSHQGSIFTKSRRNINHLRMINETNKRGYNFLRSQKKIENEHRKQLQYSFVIHPFSIFRTYWEAFMVIILFIQFIMIPLDAAGYDLHFPEKMVKSTSFMVIRCVTDFISLIDIGVNFFTGYCNDKERTVVLTPKKIFWHYLKTHFILDLISSIPSDVILNINRDYCKSVMSKNTLFVLHYGALIKLGRVANFVTYFNNVCETLDAPYVYSRLLVAGCSFLVYLHFMTCCCIAWLDWQYSWSPETSDSDRAILYYGQGISSFPKLYIRSLFSATLMICGSGYGFVATRNSSIIFVITSWIVSKLIFILLVGRCYGLYTALESSSQKYINLISDIEDYMQHKQFPAELQGRILAYYDVRFQNCFFQESEILNTVSGQLRQEIIMNTCRKLVESVTFFKNLPIPLLVRIVSCLHCEIFLTNDLITKAGSYGDSMYFVSNGTVAVYTKSGKEICHLHDGDHFGEIALVMNEAMRVATVVACEICELYRLDKKDFVRAIMPYPDLLEKILFVAAERLERTDLIDETNKQQFKFKKKGGKKENTNITFTS